MGDRLLVDGVQSHRVKPWKVLPKDFRATEIGGDDLPSVISYADNDRIVEKVCIVDQRPLSVPGVIRRGFLFRQLSCRSFDKLAIGVSIISVTILHIF